MQPQGGDGGDEKEGHLFNRVQQAKTEAALAALANGVGDPRQIHGKFGQNLMFFAAARSVMQGGAEDVARRLEALGVPPSEEDDMKQTPLFYAAREGNRACMEFLLDRQCDVDHRDVNGQSPLFYAMREGHVDACRALQQRGANFGLKDYVGRTAASYASTATIKALGAVGIVVEPNFAKTVHLRRGGQKSAAQGHPVLGGRKSIGAEVEGGAEPKRRRLRKANDTQALSIADFVANAEARGLERMPPPAEPDPAARLFHVRLRGQEHYYVAKPRLSDVLQLRAIEREFVLDHSALYKGESWASSVAAADWCAAVNVILRESEAVKAISSIVSGRSGKHSTLQCVHVPRGPQQRQPEVVGYVHFVDMAGYLDVSHLKVVAQHQRQGLALLLLASMVRHADQAGTGEGARDIRLVVMSRNAAAIRLYERLGFKRCADWTKQLKAGVQIAWTRMRRTSSEPRGRAVETFLRTCREAAKWEDL